MQTKRIVLITGAGGAIGTVLVERFLANDDTVIATDTSGDSLARLKSGRAAGAALATVVADVASEADCARLADTARQHGGRIDVLVHCAGFFPIVPFEEMSTDQWRQVIDINLTGAFLLCKAVVPLMKTTGWGRIVMYGSGSVFEGVPGQAHYVAAKAGIVGFSRSIARELGQYGITVNVVAPGLTVSPAVVKQFPAALLAEQRKGRAIARDEVPHDLVGTTFFLASPDADFVSGQTLSVDGGKSMR